MTDRSIPDTLSYDSGAVKFPACNKQRVFGRKNRNSHFFGKRYNIFSRNFAAYKTNHFDIHHFAGSNDLRIDKAGTGYQVTFENGAPIGWVRVPEDL